MVAFPLAKAGRLFLNTLNNLYMETKKCVKCGRELPFSEFYKYRSSKDGHSQYCKACMKEITKRSYHKRAGSIFSVAPIHASDANPELAKFQPRELIAELKARGYTGELRYTHTIVV